MNDVTTVHRRERLHLSIVALLLLGITAWVVAAPRPTVEGQAGYPPPPAPVATGVLHPASTAAAAVVDQTLTDLANSGFMFGSASVIWARDATATDASLLLGGVFDPSLPDVLAVVHGSFSGALTESAGTFTDAFVVISRRTGSAYRWQLGHAVTDLTSAPSQ